MKQLFLLVDPVKSLLFLLLKKWLLKFIASGELEDLVIDIVKQLFKREDSEIDTLKRDNIVSEIVGAKKKADVARR